jgi:hypothetical protein
MNSNDLLPSKRLEVACVVLMPQTTHHKPRYSSDTMTSNNEYAIGVSVCETGIPMRQESYVKKTQLKHERISPGFLV